MLCRPSGHHTYADLAGGFCYLNNAAIAAQVLVSGGAKPAVLDVDVHAGNGTQSILYERDDVFFCSVHGDPRELYPWYAGYADETGAGRGAGCNLNLPLPAGTENPRYVTAIEAGLEAIRRFDASVLIVSLGFDAHIGDPTANLAVTAEGSARSASVLAGLAYRRCWCRRVATSWRNSATISRRSWGAFCRDGERFGLLISAEFKLSLPALSR